MFKRQETVERFRSRLEEVIRASKLSRSGFAEKAGIDRSTLSQILSADTRRLPRVETLASIAVSAQVSIDWLVGLSEEGALRTEFLPIEIQPGGASPSDERLARWHSEAIGYKIRYVPTTLPDLLKSEGVIDYEYQGSWATPEQRRETSRARLNYQRRPETDMEACSTVQGLEGFARGDGLWQRLPEAVRREQLDRMIELCEELYPTFRWFLVDGLSRYSVPLTIFGPLRAALYVGQKYIVFNSREHIRALTAHFDDLIRVAALQPPGTIGRLRSLRAEL